MCYDPFTNVNKLNKVQPLSILFSILFINYTKTYKEEKCKLSGSKHSLLEVKVTALYRYICQSLLEVLSYCFYF